MFSERRMNFLVVLLVLVSNGVKACFDNKHEQINVMTGESFYKECQCTEPGYTISYHLRWLNEHGEQIGPLRPGIRSNIYTDLQDEARSLALYIRSVQKNMSGTYKCETVNNGKIYTQSYTITAYDPMYFYDTPNDQFLVYGQTSSILCQPRSDGNHVSITWQIEGENEGEFYDISDDVRHSVENNRLTIHNVTEEDAGKYKCAARAILFNEEVDILIDVKVFTLPEIKKLNANSDTANPITVVAGVDLTIECIADGTPHPDYSWNKTSEEATRKADEVSYRQEINTIFFESIKPEDSGVYTCYAFNLAGTASQNITVEVLIPPKVVAFPNITEVEGEEVQFVCNATGYPEPTITITYIGRDFDVAQNMRDFESWPNMHSITIDRSNEGLYVCEASIYQVGSHEMVMNLTVLHKPYFDEGEEYIWGWEGKTIKLNCEHDSNPDASITWRYNGNDLETEEDVEINKRLLAALNNMPGPYFDLTIDNKTAYGIYECTAKNELGEASKRVILMQAFRPRTIKYANVTELTATSVTFDLIGPDPEVDVPELTGFTANYDEEKNYNITNIHLNRTWAFNRPFKLQNLKPDTKYYVKFAAVNEVGPGDWSELMEFLTLNKSVPEPPVWNEIPIIQSIKSHTLKWRAPDDNGGTPIDHYILQYCLDEDEESCKIENIPAQFTELQLKDLEINATYFLELVAHNAQGNSTAANVTFVVPETLDYPATLLSGGAIIGISVVIVLVCLLLLDVLLLVWRHQGIIATCCCKKDSKDKESALNSRDKKGLLTNGETEDRASKNNVHKEFQYNPNTGVVTGKHSAV